MCVFGVCVSWALWDHRVVLWRPWVVPLYRRHFNLLRIPMARYVGSMPSSVSCPLSTPTRPGMILTHTFFSAPRTRALCVPCELDCRLGRFLIDIARTGTLGSCRLFR